MSPELKKRIVLLVVVLAIAFGIYSQSTPQGSAARRVVARAGLLCYLLPENDREICAELGAVASAVAEAKRAPASGEALQADTGGAKSQ
jgi:hypothetical protein